ncbi:DUF4283 domain protein, partial [Trifolium medium]|nr:DUF4283 domain protein [Trifolium medium]
RDSEASQSDYDEGQDDPEVRQHVDALVEQFAEGLEDEDEIGSQDHFQPSSNRAADEVICVEKQKVTPSRAGEAVVSQVSGTDNPVWSIDRGSGKGDSPILVGDRGSPSICSPADGLRHSVSTVGHGESSPTPCRIKRTKSCPPGVNRSVISGPWSLEWLHDLNQGDAGVIFSASKRSCKGGRGGVPQQKESTEDPKRRKT